MSEPFVEDEGLPSERAKERADEVAARDATIALFSFRRANGQALSDVAIASRVGRSLTYVQELRARWSEQQRLAEIAKLATPDGPIRPIEEPAPEVTPEPEAEPESEEADADSEATTGLLDADEPDFARKRVFTTAEAATLLKVAPRTVAKWFDAGRLKGYRIPGCQDRRIPREQLKRFIAERGMALPPELIATLPDEVVWETPGTPEPEPQQEPQSEADDAGDNLFDDEPDAADLALEKPTQTVGLSPEAYAHEARRLTLTGLRLKLREARDRLLLHGYSSAEGREAKKAIDAALAELKLRNEPEVPDDDPGQKVITAERLDKPRSKMVWWRVALACGCTSEYSRSGGSALDQLQPPQYVICDRHDGETFGETPAEPEETPAEAAPDGGDRSLDSGDFAEFKKEMGDIMAEDRLTGEAVPEQAETPTEVTPKKPRARKSRAKVKAEPQPEREGRLTHMTRQELLDNYYATSGQSLRADALREHEATVHMAVLAGKEVPERVLAEYPHLAPLVVQPEASPAQAETPAVDDATPRTVEVVRASDKPPLRELHLWGLTCWEVGARHEPELLELVEAVRGARQFYESKLAGAGDDELARLDGQERTRGLLLRLWGWIEDARDHAPLYPLASYVRGLLQMEEELITEAEGK